jgi:hypothetical protein
MRTKKLKPVTHRDVHSNALTKRKVEVTGEGLEHRSSTTIYYDCPFCKHEVKAYMWSFVACGKRCECGSLCVGNSGDAYQWTALLND